jgi:hypothetical protein
VKLGGAVDGAIGYSGEGRYQARHNAVVTIPDSPVRSEHAYLLMTTATFAHVAFGIPMSNPPA